MGQSNSQMSDVFDMNGRLRPEYRNPDTIHLMNGPHHQDCDPIIHLQFFEQADTGQKDDGPNPTVVNAMVSFASLAASLAGPVGSILGSALTIFTGIFSPSPQPDFLPIVIDAFKTLQENEKTQQQISAARAYCEWLAISQPILENMDSSNEQSMQELLAKLNATWTDELHVLYLSTLIDPTKVTWVKRPMCTVALAAVTCLVSAHSVKCRILAWLALNAHAAGNSAAAKNYRTSFANAYNTMVSTCEVKKKNIEGLLSAAIQDRVAAIRGPTFGNHLEFLPSAWHGNPQDPVPAYLWERKDMFGGRSFEQWYIEDTKTSRFIGWYMNEATFLNLHLNQPDVPRRALEVIEIVRENCAAYCKCTEWRVTHVMDQWSDSVKKVAEYIKPHMPDNFVPPQLRLEDVKEIHPWLRDAQYVSWAYALTTVDGTSSISSWTPDYQIPDPNSDGSIILPVLQLDDFNFKIATKRMVYHRKIVKDSHMEVGYTGKLVLARILDSDAFVDRMPEL